MSLALFYMAVGIYDTHSFEWPYLLKFLCTKIVRKFDFLVKIVAFLISTYVFKFLKKLMLS